MLNVARPAGGGEDPLQDGFGWTNGVLLRLLNRKEKSLLGPTQAYHFRGAAATCCCRPCSSSVTVRCRVSATAARSLP